MAKVSRYYDVRRDANGHRYLEVAITGFSMLRLPLLNKSTAFTLEEREVLEVDGLIPPHVSTMLEQKARQYERYQAQSSDLEKLD